MAESYFGTIGEPTFEVSPDGGFTAYDLLFEGTDGQIWSYPYPSEGSLVDADGEPAAHSVPAGRIGPIGPGITGEQWPRDPRTGLPMLHAITLWLPEPYRRRGPDLAGIALFQGVGEGPEPIERTDETDPFIADLRRHRPHPEQILLTDILGCHFAVIWLTADELSRCGTPPADCRRDGEHRVYLGDPNAWDHDHPEMLVRLTVRRDDPNVGIAPVDIFGADTNSSCSPYTDPFGDDDYHEWADRLQANNHLGGTLFPAQLVPDGLTPFYLDLVEISGMNIGSGSLQYDLESGVFDWSCS
ncbi:hypothetical protein [Gordonia sp. NB41Y]|uniref:hypothetical protein n=1 Tax=Gordonia sp. NB41Y TaxID=875808 RepID=UPI0002BE6284|nr:hypothetical protein [Gordonia sp. NB41Y]WLP88536.1 hypothetical protein Q9K23_12950 [Gordonia sp. NB41Y]